VVTRDPSFASDKARTISIDKKSDLPIVTKLGVIGGGELNGQLAKLGLLDEMVLDIEPIKLNSGTRLFGEYDIPLKLKLLGSKRIGEATVQRHYKILKQSTTRSSEPTQPEPRI
jgi:dihydrofolate reductase